MIYSEQHHIKRATMQEAIPKMASPVLHVHPERCLLVRNRNAECLRCASVCTTGALSKGPQGIEVNPDLCIGCGTCASACPTCCLEAVNPTDEQLEEEAVRAIAQNDGQLVICCSTAEAMAREAAGITDDVAFKLDGKLDIVPVVCLGRTEESFLVESVVRGAKHITLIGGHCQDCQHHAGAELCRTLCQSAQELLRAFGNDTVVEKVLQPQVSMVPAGPKPQRQSAGLQAEEHHSAMSRAEVVNANLKVNPNLRHAVVKKNQTDAMFTHVKGDGTLPHFIPERRLRLFNSLKQLGSPTQDSIDSRLWGQVTINTDLCRSCRMCTVFCPTGAVSRFDAGKDRFGVEHRSTLCMQCRLCEEICPEKAITVSSTVSLPEFASGKKYRFTMNPVGWDVDGPNSITTRMSRFIKVDAVMDAQADIKREEMAKIQEYARKREEQRAQIRAAQQQED